MEHVTEFALDRKVTPGAQATSKANFSTNHAKLRTTMFY